MAFTETGLMLMYGGQASMDDQDRLLLLRLA